MRIAAFSPNYSFLTGDRTLHRYAEYFINTYCEKVVTYEEAKSYDGDIIISFNGRPDLPGNCPPKEFKGIKIVHLLDHTFQATKALKTLEESEISYLMGYNAHDKYDSFFNAYYTPYVGKILGVPFGYNDLRFSNKKPFNERLKKVVALGSVNPVRDPLCLEDIKDFAAHFQQEGFTHKWRRTLVREKRILEDVMDSLLPEFPLTKDFGYDIVQKYNDYQLFTSCESIMNYPSVKTFEGMACGSVLVCSDAPCYKDIGLVHGVNCLMHAPHEVGNFSHIVKEALMDQPMLEQIARNGQKFVEENFHPKKIAANLYSSLQLLCKRSV